MVDDATTRINRPRQVYTGMTERAFQPLADREKQEVYA
jgi:citrate synthase